MFGYEKKVEAIKRASSADNQKPLPQVPHAALYTRTLGSGGGVHVNSRPGILHQPSTSSLLRTLYGKTVSAPIVQ